MPDVLQGGNDGEFGILDALGQHPEIIEPDVRAQALRIGAVAFRAEDAGDVRSMWCERFGLGVYLHEPPDQFPVDRPALLRILGNASHPVRLPAIEVAWTTSSRLG
jgi:hypothetical protein